MHIYWSAVIKDNFKELENLNLKKEFFCYFTVLLHSTGYIYSIVLVTGYIKDSK